MRNKTQFPKVPLVCLILTHLTSQVELNMLKKNASTKIAIYSTLILPITKLEARKPDRALVMNPRSIISLLSRTLVLRSLARMWFSMAAGFVGNRRLRKKS